MSGNRGCWIALGLAALLIATAAVSCTFGLALGTAAFGPGALELGDAVALVRVEGVIVSGEDPLTPFATQDAYSHRVIRHLERAEEDPTVKAIVLRVDSPGGGVVASDEIHAAMLRVTKPVVVSMGELGASGGYYISAPADLVLASPGTLTGSIGVIAMVPNLEDLLDMVGVEMIVIKSGELKDLGSPYDAFTEQEREVWEEIIAEAYEGFLQIVAEGREMPLQEVRRLADGRIYTGRQAAELGLVDALGDLEDAIERAADLGGISGPPRLVEYRRELSLLDAVLGYMDPQVRTPNVDDLLGIQRRFTLQYLYVEP